MIQTSDLFIHSFQLTKGKYGIITFTKLSFVDLNKSETIVSKHFYPNVTGSEKNSNFDLNMND